jgi:hypothetical protein
MNFLVEMKSIPFTLSPLRELDSGGVRAQVDKDLRKEGRLVGWCQPSADADSVVMATF